MTLVEEYGFKPLSGEAMDSDKRMFRGKPMDRHEVWDLLMKDYPEESEGIPDLPTYQDQVALTWALELNLKKQPWLKQQLNDLLELHLSGSLKGKPSRVDEAMAKLDELMPLAES